MVLRNRCNYFIAGGSIPVTKRPRGARRRFNGEQPGNGALEMERIIRRFAGTFILASLLLAHYHDPKWLWLTAFVGFNLLQSSFTKFCPLEIVLRKAGVGGRCGACEKNPTPASERV